MDRDPRMLFSKTIPFLWSSKYTMIILSVLFVICQCSVYTIYKIMYIVWGMWALYLLFLFLFLALFLKYSVRWVDCCIQFHRVLFKNWIIVDLQCCVSFWCTAKWFPEPACQCRRHKRHGFDPWVGKIPWRRATHSSILAWRIPWTEEPGWLQSIGSQKVGHDRVTSYTHI